MKRIIMGLLIAGAIIFIIAYLATQRDQPASPVATTPTASPITIVSPSPAGTPHSTSDDVTMDMFVESVGEDRVGFMNSRILQVNEGHVVVNVYVTDETEIDNGITVDNLEELDLGTAVRIIGTSAEGGILASRIIVNPPHHSPVPQLL